MHDSQGCETKCLETLALLPMLWITFFLLLFAGSHSGFSQGIVSLHKCIGWKLDTDGVEDSKVILVLGGGGGGGGNSCNDNSRHSERRLKRSVSKFGHNQG